MSDESIVKTSRCMMDVIECIRPRLSTTRLNKSRTDMTRSGSTTRISLTQPNLVHWRRTANPGTVVLGLIVLHALMPSDNASRDNNPLSSVSPPAPSPAGSVSNGSASGRKRRASGTGSRGVANLTPDQLAKKRANDREAQRAIRERTKNQIDSLERTIRELRSQQPYQELQHAIRQKEVVEAENAEIKRRLASVLSIIQPLIGNHGQGKLAHKTDLSEGTV